MKNDEKGQETSKIIENKEEITEKTKEIEKKTMKITETKEIAIQTSVEKVQHFPKKLKLLIKIRLIEISIRIR